MELITFTYPYLGIYTKSFLLSNSEYNVFIDSGLATGGEKLIPYLKNGKKNILLMTHGHWDHIGCNSLIKENAGTIYAAKRDKKMLEDYTWHWQLLFGQFEKDFDLPAARRTVFNESVGKAVGLDISVKDGDIFDFGDISLKAIATPGHSGGSICYFEENSKLLFTGDALMQDGFFSGTAQIERFDEYIKSMEKLKTIDAKTVLTDHTEPFSGEEIEAAAERSIDCAKRFLGSVESYSASTDTPNVSDAAKAIATAENKNVGGGTCVSALGALNALGFVKTDYVVGE